MASSCCFQHFMCFLYSFHNYSKMQLSEFSANQHKEIITTVQGKSSCFTYWTFLSSAFGCSGSAVTRSSTQTVSIGVFVTQVVPMEDPSLYRKLRQRVKKCVISASSSGVRCPSGYPTGVWTSVQDVTFYFISPGTRFQQVWLVPGAGKTLNNELSVTKLIKDWYITRMPMYGFLMRNSKLLTDWNDPIDRSMNSFPEIRKTTFK